MFWMESCDSSKRRCSEFSLTSASAATVLCALRSLGAEFDHVAVSVGGGFLVIEGHVRTPEERRRAGNVAASIAGHDHVRNRVFLLEPSIALVEGGWLSSDTTGSENSSGSSDCFDWSKLSPIEADASTQVPV